MREMTTCPDCSKRFDRLHEAGEVRGFLAVLRSCNTCGPKVPPDSPIPLPPDFDLAPTFDDHMECSICRLRPPAKAKSLPQDWCSALRVNLSTDRVLIVATLCPCCQNRTLVWINERRKELAAAPELAAVPRAT
jgi:hypothetical protein